MSVNKYDKVNKMLIPIAKNQIQTSAEAIDDAVERATQDKQDKIQFTVMPTASADNLGKVYQYVGNSTATYTSGVFYKCVYDGTDYEWRETSAGEIEKITSAQVADMWDGAYTHGRDAFLADEAADEIIDEIKSRLENKADKGNSLADYGITDAYTKSKTDEKIDAAISSVYKPAGSKAFEDLPVLSGTLLGNVYNITNSFITDTRFAEGTGKEYPAGTNVVVVVVVENDTNTYWYDVLSGFIDLTDYAKYSDISQVAKTGNYADLEKQPQWYVDDDGVLGYTIPE